MAELVDTLRGGLDSLLPSLQNGFTLVLKFISMCFGQEEKWAALIGENFNLDAETVTGLSLFLFAAFVIGAYSFVRKSLPILRNGLALLALLVLVVLAIGFLFPSI